MTTNCKKYAPNSEYIFTFSLKDAVVVGHVPREGTSSATCCSLDTQFTYLAHAFSM